MYFCVKYVIPLNVKKLWLVRYKDKKKKRECMSDAFEKLGR